MSDRERSHVDAGWDLKHFRWIETGLLRLEEDDDGACVSIGLESTSLSSTELATAGGPRCLRHIRRTSRAAGMAARSRCLECSTDRAAIERLLAQHGWFMSMMSPPGQGPDVPIVVGAVCGTCAPTVCPPEALKVAEERRLKILEEKKTKP